MCQTVGDLLQGDISRHVYTDDRSGPSLGTLAPLDSQVCTSNRVTWWSRVWHYALLFSFLLLLPFAQYLSYLIILSALFC